MSDIFSSPNILVQTQLGYYLYHPEIKPKNFFDFWGFIQNFKKFKFCDLLNHLDKKKTRFT